MLNTYRRVTATLTARADMALFLLRVVTGWLFIDHALTKYGAPGGLDSFKQFLVFLNVPAADFLSRVVPVVELGGGILLIIGLLTRPAALVLAGEMAFTGFVVKLHDTHLGVIAAASTPAPGAELDFMYLIALIAIVILGAGRLSGDAVIGLEAAYRGNDRVVSQR